jgi:SAM-dependent methyltransferase
MPFSPLPKKFLEDLTRITQQAGRVVELGCGDGKLAELLRRIGARPLLLDRRHPRLGSAAQVVGDARRPPLRRGTVDLLLAANVIRHLGFPRSNRPVPAVWHDLVAPGGCLYVFEDSPESGTPALNNYRDLQTYLARVAPELRRPLVPRARFATACRRERSAPAWRFGRERNTWPCDIEVVLQLLAGVREEPASPAGEGRELRDRIARDGLDYGYYWWARWERTVS